MSISAEGSESVFLQLDLFKLLPFSEQVEVVFWLLVNDLP